MAKSYRYTLVVGSLALILGGMAFLTYRSVPLTFTGITQLQDATNTIASNPAEASKKYQAASSSLQNALSQIRQSGPAVLLSPLPPFRWVVHLNKAAAYLADVGTDASTALASYHPPAAETDINSQLSAQSSTFLSWYAAHPQTFDIIQQNLNAADTELSSIPSWIFFSRRAEFEKLATEVHSAAASFPKLRALTATIQAETGTNDSDPHTFLVVFQNDAELRPTGGFLGSYGTLNASSGIIRTFTFGQDIYKLDTPYTQLTKIAPPEPLKTITTAWAFRDSTVGTGFIDDGSKNIQRFYTAETGQHINGVIYLDSSVLEDFLRVTGPITLPDGKTVVDATSINLILTKQIEQDYFQTPANQAEDQPKKILNNLIPILIAKLQKTPGALHALLPVLQKETERKSIQLWFADNHSELAAQAIFPLDAPAPQGTNWVKIVNTNLDGLKSSRSVEQDVKITHTTVNPSRLTQTIQITRKHTGTGVWPDHDNNNYMEVYLPADAEVTALPIGQGGESQLPLTQQEELGTVGKIVQPSVTKGEGWVKVGFWATTKVGQTTTYSLTYTLPLTSETMTTLAYIKQAGAQREYLNAFSYNGPVTGNVIARE